MHIDWPPSPGADREVADLLRIAPPLVFCFVLGVVVTLAVEALTPPAPPPKPAPCLCQHHQRPILEEEDEALCAR